MKSAAIYIHGLPHIDKPEPQKTVKFENEKILITHLKELQKGYSEIGDSKPKINRLIHPRTGNIIIECYNDADFRHVAYCGMRIKDEANKPTEIIN